MTEDKSNMFEKLMKKLGYKKDPEPDLYSNVWYYRHPENRKFVLSYVDGCWECAANTGDGISVNRGTSGVYSLNRLRKIMEVN